MKSILKKIHDSCKTQKPKDDAPAPLTCGTDEEYKD